MRLTLMLLVNFIWRDLLKNRVRTLLTLSGIALGVAVILAINVANQASLAKFRESIDLVSGKTNLEICSTSEPWLDEAVLDQLRFLWDSKVRFTPVIEEIAALDAPSPEVVQVLGVDMLADAAFRPLGTSFAQEADEMAIFKRNRAYVGWQLARRHRLSAGSWLRLLVNDEVQSLEVVGVLASDGLGRAFGGNLILMDIGTAQYLFHMKERLTRIELVVPEKDLAGIAARLRSSLPAGCSVDRPQRRGDQVEKMLRSFHFNLAALSMIAFLVSMFMIYNTMSISVIRRRWELGTLRALGVTRTGIFSLVITEAAGLGLVGASAGILLGLGFARIALGAVSRTVESLYANQPPVETGVDPLLVFAVFVSGVLITVGASAAPALEAVSIAPAEAAKDASYERKFRRLSRGLAATSAVLAGCAGLASLQSDVGGFPVFGYICAACAVFAAALATPASLRGTFAVLSLLSKKCASIEPRLAISGMNGALGRTSVAVASLVVGISMMVSLAIMIGSFRETVIAWVNQTLRADLWVEPATRRASNRTGRLKPLTIDLIRAVDGVAAVDAFVEFPIEYREQPANLGAGDLDVMIKSGNLVFVDGEPGKQVLERVRDGGGAVVSEAFALRHHHKKGDAIALLTQEGRLETRIEGVYYDYSSDQGYVILSREVFNRHFNHPDSTTAAVYLKQGADPERVKSDILRQTGAGTGLRIRTNGELKAAVLRVFDNTFAITYALHAIAVTIAILTVVNALVALGMEARRDMGILKYLGMSGPQLQNMVLIQAGILGFCGNAGGLGLGFVLSLLLIHVINKQSFGWTIQLCLPAEFLIQSTGLVIAFSFLAGLVPARMVARTPAPHVLRYE